MSAFTLTPIHNHASKKYLTNYFHFQKTTDMCFQNHCVVIKVKKLEITGTKRQNLTRI